MYECKVTIEGISPLTFGKLVKDKKIVYDWYEETGQQHEDRTWPQRIHTAENGQAFIPAMAFQIGLKEIAKHHGHKIVPASARFQRGTMVTADLLLFDSDGEPIMAKDIEACRYCLC